MRNRESSSTQNAGAAIESNRPTTKTSEVMMIARRRPRVSATRPAASAPTAAPTSRIDTTVPCRNGVSRVKSLLMFGSTPPMTPVS